MLMIEYLSIVETFVLNSAFAIYSKWGWLGVVALITFENATGITPSEIILGLAGWMLISEQQLPPTMIFVGAFYAAIGSVMGASISYWVARLGGRPIVDKVAGWLRIDKQHINRSEIQFQRWGSGLVLIGRLMPGIRTLISIPAGLSRMPYFTFVLVTFIGAYMWCTLLIGAGYILGNEWNLVSGLLKQNMPYLLGGGALALIIFLAIKFKLHHPIKQPIHIDEGQDI
jgi:membrane protein DedA with SNARE-associated domain